MSSEFSFKRLWPFKVLRFILYFAVIAQGFFALFAIYLSSWTPYFIREFALKILSSFLSFAIFSNEFNRIWVLNQTHWSNELRNYFALQCYVDCTIALVCAYLYLYLAKIVSQFLPKRSPTEKMETLLKRLSIISAVVIVLVLISAIISQPFGSKEQQLITNLYNFYPHFFDKVINEFSWSSFTMLSTFSGVDAVFIFLAAVAGLKQISENKKLDSERKRLQNEVDLTV